MTQTLNDQEGLNAGRERHRGRRGWERARGAAPALPAVFILLCCNVLPLAWMASLLLTHPAVRAEFRVGAFRAQLLGRTIGFNAAAALIAAAMGLPAAFVLGRGRGRLARLLWVVLPTTLLLPSISYVYGWSQVVRILRPALRPLGITFAPNDWADRFRCIWSLGTWLWAVPAVLVGLSLRRMDSAVQEHAVLDGALRRVTLRQLAGPIIASMAIVTILATQEFAVYEPTGISVVATEVRMVFDTGSMSSADNSIAAPGFLGGGLSSPDQPARAAAAVAACVPLLAITVVLALVAARGAAAGAADADAPTAARWPRVLDASPAALVTTVLLVALNVGVPVVALVCSLRNGLSAPRLLRQFGPQVNGSLLVAAAAAAVALIAAASGAARRLPGALAIAGATFLVGGQLLAIGLIRIYNRPGLFWAYDCWVVPAAAYFGRFGWLAIAAGQSTWSRGWRELREMAAVDGASPARTARSVVWPLAWPTLLAGGLLVGALSLTEVPATVLLMPQHPQVLTPMLMTWVHMVRYDPMIEASLLMMATLLLPGLAGVLLVSLGRRLQQTLRTGQGSRDSR